MDIIINDETKREVLAVKQRSDIIVRLKMTPNTMEMLLTT